MVDVVSTMMVYFDPALRFKELADAVRVAVARV